MKLCLDVTFADGSATTVKVTPKVETALERKYEMTLEESKRREHVFFAAFVGLKHAGKEVGDDFDAFLDTLEDVQLVDGDEQEPDPTNPE